MGFAVAGAAFSGDARAAAVKLFAVPVARPIAAAEALSPRTYQAELEPELGQKAAGDGGVSFCTTSAATGAGRFEPLPQALALEVAARPRALGASGVQAVSGKPYLVSALFGSLLSQSSSAKRATVHMRVLGRAATLEYRDGEPVRSGTPHFVGLPNFEAHTSKTCQSSTTGNSNRRRRNREGDPARSALAWQASRTRRASDAGGETDPSPVIGTDRSWVAAGSLQLWHQIPTWNAVRQLRRPACDVAPAHRDSLPLLRAVHRRARTRVAHGVPVSELPSRCPEDAHTPDLVWILAGQRQTLAVNGAFCGLRLPAINSSSHGMEPRCCGTSVQTWRGST